MTAPESTQLRLHAQGKPDSALPLPLALGHYVPWYTLEADAFPLPPADADALVEPPALEDFRHWRDERAGYRRTHLHMPAIGLYDSRDPRVLEWQFHTALDYGLSGFIVNWYGMNSVENVITLHFLRALQQWNREHPEKYIHYFLSLDSQAQRPTEGKTPVPMEDDFRYIRDHLLTDAYLCRNGHPVFAVFPYEDNCATWRHAADAALGPGHADLLWMNGCPGAGETSTYPWVRPDDSALDCDALYAWTDPENAGLDWLRGFYESAGQHGVPYLMGGVWPGFDDQLVSWAWQPAGDDAHVRPRVICRENELGNTLEQTWDVYLDYLRSWATDTSARYVPAPLVQVVTWNDYAEASTVEPTRDYGTAPLEMCRRKIEEARLILGNGCPVMGDQ